MEYGAHQLVNRRLAVCGGGEIGDNLFLAETAGENGIEYPLGIGRAERLARLGQGKAAGKSTEALVTFMTG
jgi:hypothetical protein